MTLLIHILAGGLGLVAGYVALSATKGAPLHRKNLGDRRMIRAGGLQGTRRLARHLWRTCFALFIASIAFYTGQGRVPEVIRSPALLAAGVLLPLLAMLYWLWRVRRRRTFRGIVGVSAPEAI
jgi:hypothetical protein